VSSEDVHGDAYYYAAASRTTVTTSAGSAGSTATGGVWANARWKPDTSSP
jgi:hypothetical protein